MNKGLADWELVLHLESTLGDQTQNNVQILTNVLKFCQPGTLAVPRQGQIRRRGQLGVPELPPKEPSREAGLGPTPTTPPCVQTVPPIGPPPPARCAAPIGGLSNLSEHTGAYWANCRGCVAHFPAQGARRGRRLAAIAFPPNGGLCEGLRGVSGGL